MNDGEIKSRNRKINKTSATVERYFWLLIYFLSPVIPILFIYNSDTEKWGSPLNGISMIAGTTGFVWFVYEFVLSARPKFIERSFGLDKFYVFHGVMAIVSVLLIVIHRNLARGFGWTRNSTDYGNLAHVIFLGITVLGLIFISGSILLRIKPIAKLKNFFSAYKIFKYNNQVLIHNLVIVAYVFMCAHVYFTSAIQENSAVKFIFMTYFILGAVFYIYHTVIIKVLLKNNLFIVKEVVKESENMWTLRLTPKKGEIFPYKPGQFAYIKIFGKDVRAEVHPFSISSSPSNTEYISFTIKELGDFTNEIRKVSVGDQVQVDGPYGRFSYKEYPSEKNTVLIAGGVGITPNLGMLQYMKEEDKDRQVLLLWGINDRKDLICLEEFEDIQKQMKNFYFVPVMFRDQTWDGERGIIDREKIEKMLKLYKIEIDESGFYVCGPPILTNGVISSLKSMEVKKERIHFERFSM